MDPQSPFPAADLARTSTWADREGGCRTERVSGLVRRDGGDAGGLGGRIGSESKRIESREAMPSHRSEANRTGDTVPSHAIAAARGV
jgi:hypothetical protein